MKLKPYRFKLTVGGMAVTALLLFLKNSFPTWFFDILLVICDLINWPAMLIYQHLAMFEGIHIWSRHSWYNLGLCLALVGLWWYFVGLELDFDLLRRTAKKISALKICWLIVTAGIQGIVIYIFYGAVIEIRRPGPLFHVISLADYFLNGFLLLIIVGWLEAAAFRFWRASRPLHRFTKAHSL